MKKAFLLLWSWGLFFVTLSAQDRVDSLFYLNGKVEVVSILRNSSESIECNYPGEDMITAIEKSKLHKIIFKSGRVEICNQYEEPAKNDIIYFINGDETECRIIRVSDETIEYKLPGENLVVTMPYSSVNKIEYSNGRVVTNQNAKNLHRFYETYDWEDVVVTYNVSDTRGLVRVEDLHENAHSIGHSGFSLDRAIKHLQQEAAALGCGLILINGSTNSAGAPNPVNPGVLGSYAHITATAYKLPDQTDNPRREARQEAYTQQVISKFYNGEIYQLPEEEQEKMVYVYEERVYRLVYGSRNERDLQVAKMMATGLIKFLNSFEKPPRWVKKVSARVDSYFAGTENWFKKPDAK